MNTSALASKPCPPARSGAAPQRNVRVLARKNEKRYTVDEPAKFPIELATLGALGTVLASTIIGASQQDSVRANAPNESQQLVDDMKAVAPTPLPSITSSPDAPSTKADKPRAASRAAAIVPDQVASFTGPPGGAAPSVPMIKQREITPVPAPAPTAPVVSPDAPAPIAAVKAAEEAEVAAPPQTFKLAPEPASPAPAPADVSSDVSAETPESGFPSLPIPTPFSAPSPPPAPAPTPQAKLAPLPPAAEEAPDSLPPAPADAVIGARPTPSSGATASVMSGATPAATNPLVWVLGVTVLAAAGLSASKQGGAAGGSMDASMGGSMDVAPRTPPAAERSLEDRQGDAKAWIAAWKNKAKK